MKTSPLKVLRVEAGLTQKELSNLSGVDASYISLLETQAKTNVSIQVARKLTTALSKRLGRRVTLLDLFPEDDHPSGDTRTA